MPADAPTFPRTSLTPSGKCGRRASDPGRPVEDDRGRIPDDPLHAERGSRDRRQVPRRSSQGERHDSEVAPAHHGAATKAIENSQGSGSIPASERVYQFKITLKGIAARSGGESRPRTAPSTNSTNISRRQWAGRTPTSTSSRSAALRRSRMLYEGLEDEEPPVNSRRLKMSKIMPTDGKRFRFEYEYDFGDGWQHEILFEGCLKAEKGTGSALPRGRAGLPTRRCRRHLRLPRVCASDRQSEAQAARGVLEWSGPFDPEN